MHREEASEKSWVITSTIFVRRSSRLKGTVSVDMNILRYAALRLFIYQCQENSHVYLVTLQSDDIQLLQRTQHRDTVQNLWHGKSISLKSLQIQTAKFCSFSSHHHVLWNILWNLNIIAPLSFYWEFGEMRARRGKYTTEPPPMKAKEPIWQNWWMTVAPAVCV